MSYHRSCRFCRHHTFYYKILNKKLAFLLFQNSFTFSKWLSSNSMALINGTAFDGPKNAANIATHSRNKYYK